MAGVWLLADSIGPSKCFHLCALLLLLQMMGFALALLLFCVDKNWIAAIVHPTELIYLYLFQMPHEDGEKINGGETRSPWDFCVQVSWLWEGGSPSGDVSDLTPPLCHRSGQPRATTWALFTTPTGICSCFCWASQTQGFRTCSYMLSIRKSSTRLQIILKYLSALAMTAVLLLLLVFS